MLRLAGAFSFRDLGGLPAGGGRRTRSGLVFRSNCLQNLTAADLELLDDEVGLSTIVDLRSPDEIVRDGLPDRPGGVRYANVPLMMESRLELLHQPGGLAVRYRQYLDAGAAGLIRVLEMMSAGEALPLVFHCTAGKDRTGVVAAVLLACLTVERDVIVGDYCATQDRRDELLEFLRRRGGFDDLRLSSPLLDAQPETMREFLDWLDAEHGGAEAWVRRAGMAPAVLERLRANLLEDGSAPPAGAPIRTAPGARG
ncbi:MAG: tyrosine-protein phosphatase [Acidimicrobiia bacterium]